MSQSRQGLECFVLVISTYVRLGALAPRAFNCAEISTVFQASNAPTRKGSDRDKIEAFGRHTFYFEFALLLPNTIAGYLCGLK